LKIVDGSFDCIVFATFVERVVHEWLEYPVADEGKSLNNVSGVVETHDDCSCKVVCSGKERTIG
jgi:hypothetical protein